MERFNSAQPHKHTVALVLRYWSLPIGLRKPVFPFPGCLVRDAVFTSAQVLVATAWKFVSSPRLWMSHWNSYRVNSYRVKFMIERVGTWKLLGKRKVSYIFILDCESAGLLIVNKWKKSEYDQKSLQEINAHVRQEGSARGSISWVDGSKGPWLVIKSAAEESSLVLAAAEQISTAGSISQVCNTFSWPRRWWVTFFLSVHRLCPATRLGPLLTASVEGRESCYHLLCHSQDKENLLSIKKGAKEQAFACLTIRVCIMILGHVAFICMYNSCD